MAIDVFISYSRQDFSKVQKLAGILAPLGVIWWDEEIVSGTRFWPEIQDKITRARVCLVMVSETSSASDWVAKEISTALDAQRTIIPIRLDASPLPNSVKHLDAIDLRDWDGVSESDQLAQLQRDIRLFLETTNESGIYIPPSAMNPSVSLGQNSFTIPDLSGKLVGNLAVVSWAISFFLLFDNFGWSAIGWGLLASIPLTFLFVIAWSLLLVSLLIAGSGINVLPLQIRNAGSRLILGLLAASIVFGGAWIGSKTLLESDSKRQVYVIAQEIKAETNVCDLFEQVRVSAPGIIKRRFLMEYAPSEIVGPGSLRSDEGSCSAIAESLKSPVAVAAYCWRHEFNLTAQQSFSGAHSPGYSASGQFCGLEDAQANDTAVGPQITLVVGLPPDEAWTPAARAALARGDLTMAASIIEPYKSRSAEALHISGIIRALSEDILDRRRGYEDVAAAARAGSTPALANQALFLMLGVGVFIDPGTGETLFQEAMNRGLDIETATWLWPNVLRNYTLGTFSEAFQSLTIASNSGAPAAKALLGVFAARGITRPPCAPRCREIAQAYAEDLAAQGKYQWAFIVQAQLGDQTPRAVAAAGAKGTYASYLLHRDSVSTHAAFALAEIKREQNLAELAHLIAPFLDGIGIPGVTTPDNADDANVGPDHTATQPSGGRRH